MVAPLIKLTATAMRALSRTPAGKKTLKKLIKEARKLGASGTGAAGAAGAGGAAAAGVLQEATNKAEGDRVGTPMQLRRNAKGGLIKSSRRKSKSKFDGIAKRGHTRAPHRS